MTPGGPHLDTEDNLDHIVRAPGRKLYDPLCKGVEDRAVREGALPYFWNKLAGSIYR